MISLGTLSTAWSQELYLSEAQDKQNSYLNIPQLTTTQDDESSLSLNLTSHEETSRSLQRNDRRPPLSEEAKNAMGEQNASEDKVAEKRKEALRLIGICVAIGLIGGISGIVYSLISTKSDPVDQQPQPARPPAPPQEQQVQRGEGNVYGIPQPAQQLEGAPDEAVVGLASDQVQPGVEMADFS